MPQTQHKTAGTLMRSIIKDEPDINFLVNQQQSTFTLGILAERHNAVAGPKHAINHSNLTYSTYSSKSNPRKPNNKRRKPGSSLPN